MLRRRGGSPRRRNRDSKDQKTAEEGASAALSPFHSASASLLPLHRPRTCHLMDMPEESPQRLGVALFHCDPAPLSSRGSAPADCRGPQVSASPRQEPAAPLCNAFENTPAEAGRAGSPEKKSAICYLIIAGREGGSPRPKPRRLLRHERSCRRLKTRQKVAQDLPHKTLMW
jgi:hypothetical protein